MDNLQNKTLPTNSGERNEEVCENNGGITGIEVIVKPIVVPVPLATIPVEIQDVAIAVGVP